MTDSASPYAKRHSQVAMWLRQIRAYQWPKNVFVLTPLPFVLAQSDALQGIVSLFVVYSAFCAAASSIYIWNDLVDLDRDRRHPQKCRRPLAAGALSRRAAIRMCIGLTAVSATLALWLNGATFILLLAYLALGHTYSVRLKHLPIVDLLAVAGLYSLRTAAGFSAVSVFPSRWLGWTALAFLLALLIELGKRMSEAAAMPAGSGTRSTLAYYSNTRRANALFLSISPCLCLVYLVTVSAITPIMAATVLLVVLGLYRFRRNIAALRRDVHPQRIILHDPMLVALIAVFVGAVIVAAGGHRTPVR